MLLPQDEVLRDSLADGDVVAPAEVAALTENVVDTSGEDDAPGVAAGVAEVEAVVVAETEADAALDAGGAGGFRGSARPLC